MDKYRDELAKFLSEPENLEVIWELYDLFPTKEDLRRKLLFSLAPEFLQGLRESLKKKFIEGNHLDFDISYAPDDEYPWVVITKETWDYFKIAFEFGIPENDSYYGIPRDIETYPFLKRNIAIEEKADTSFIEFKGYKRSEGWLYYWIIKDFTGLNQLQELLHGNRDRIIEEYSNMLFDFATENETRIDELEKFAKSLDKEKR